MNTKSTSIETQQNDYLVDSSVNDARWLFGFVMFSGVAVFAAGLIASIFAG
ncbi:MAG: hypothetical protein QNJ29_00630 [Rhizobiaceae bacterium]|nr:hypothetical protein [Rhizobiaceae bacterium]